MTSRSTLRIFSFGLVIVLGLLVGQVIFNTKSASAITGSDFRANHIVDDIILYNGNALSSTDVQNFLNAKVPTCDTNGTQASTHWNDGAGRYYTRAEWGSAHGYPAPYTCLKNYSESTSSKAADTYCTNAYTGGTKSAAQIITDVGVACNISQKSMIVLLQKEQGLVTDDWPWSIQYRSATGYGCPDTAACDSQYYGFFNQVYNAARQYQRYAKQPTNYNYRAGLTSFIQYNPNSGCGGTNVAVDNAATAGLYNYTPYQPNAAALNNLYGTGDSCSAYGNRNFWRMYSDWFNFNPSSMIINSVTLQTVAAPASTPARGQSITYTVTFTNNLTVDLPIDGIGIVGRLGSITSGANRDFGWQGPLTLLAGQSRQFTFTGAIQDVGTFYVWPAILYQGGFVQYNNWGNTLVSHAPNLTLSQPLLTSVGTVYAGQNVTFTAKLKNNETSAINYDAIGIPVKFYDYYNYDAVWVGPGSVAAGGEVTLSGTRNIDKPGPFTYWVSNYYAGQYTTVGAVKKFTSNEVAPNFSVSGLTFNTTTPVIGGALSASFTITNNLPVGIDVGGVGVVGRQGSINGTNRDLAWNGPVHFNANETKSFSGYSRTITDVGTHYYWIGIFNNGGYLQYNNWGSTIVSRAPNFSVSGLSFNTTTPASGGTLTASFTVTNNLTVPLDVTAVGVVGRFGSISGVNRDLAWNGPVHFNANETKSFSGYSRTITDVGTHYYWIGVQNNGGFLQYNNWGSTIVSH